MNGISTVYASASVSESGVALHVVCSHSRFAWTLAEAKRKPDLKLTTSGLLYAPRRCPKRRQCKWTRFTMEYAFSVHLQTLTSGFEKVLSENKMRRYVQNAGVTRTVTNAWALTQKLNHRLANLQAEKERTQSSWPRSRTVHVQVREACWS